MTHPLDPPPAMLNLDEALLAEAARELAGRDPDFAAILDAYGLPPIWARPPGFATLVHIILEQQVSLASARAAFAKLQAALGAVTPDALLALDDPALKEIGFSRQKAAYARGLAQAVLTKTLDLDALPGMTDMEAREALIRVKGIGPWTADIYLLMALLRPDVWPRGDLALAAAVRAVKRLPEIPSYEALEALSQAWRPWRSVAARLFWHHYLSRGG